jgi:pectate lyase
MEPALTDGVVPRLATMNLHKLSSKHRRLLLIVLLLDSCTQSGGAPQSAGLPAFPGAQGYGATTRGGRGGRVIEVTNLADSGPGSLRAALESHGPRIVVFEIGGTITTRSIIAVDNPYLTVAGQTAPGGGITLKASPAYNQGSLSIRTHDVILRSFRIRPGASTRLSDSRRGLQITAGSYNVIVDHLSISWATDVSVSIIDGSHNVTVQNSIISETLQHSTSVDGPHSKGFNISVKNYASDEKTRNISIHNNLFADNDYRNPEADAFGPIDFRNNVIYNYGARASVFGDLNGANTPVNIVGNYYKEGPNGSNTYEVDGADRSAKSHPSFYVRGNIGPHRPDNGMADDLIVDPRDRGYVVDSAFEVPLVTTTPATRAYTEVLVNAGTTVPMRDAVDQRLILEVRDGIGQIIDDPAQVGGWPSLPAGTPRADSDHNGLPNAWEQNHGLNPQVDESSDDRNRDGYTNIEEYLNSLMR